MARVDHSYHDSNQSETQSTSAKKYPLLTQFGIPSDLLSTTIVDRFRYIIRDIEKLNLDHDLSFMRINSMPLITTTEPMFEHDEGNKKDILGVDTYEICDSFRFDLDRYLEEMVSEEELFLVI